jgi:hypothetical protein
MLRLKNLKKVIRNNYQKKQFKILPATNSGLQKWRKKCKIHVYFSQEILSLTENNQFRSSQLTPSVGTLVASNPHHTKNRNNN